MQRLRGQLRRGRRLLQRVRHRLRRRPAAAHNPRVRRRCDALQLRPHRRVCGAVVARVVNSTVVADGPKVKSAVHAINFCPVFSGDATTATTRHRLPDMHSPESRQKPGKPSARQQPECDDFSREPPPPPSGFPAAAAAAAAAAPEIRRRMQRGTADGAGGGRAL